jgi:hypothetical protein
MKLNIENFIRVSRAEIEIPGGVTLIAGPNGAGKTTIMRALSACLMRKPIPLYTREAKTAITTSQASMLVLRGEKSGSAGLTDDDGQLTVVDWPKGVIKTGPKGGNGARTATAMDCGMVSWDALRPETRIRMLEELGGLLPTRDDFDTACRDLGIDGDAAWDTITRQGWDACHRSVTDQWSQAKGQWREVTLEQYGEVKAPKWVPRGWEPELSGEDTYDLEASVARATEDLEASIANAATDGARLEALRAFAEQSLPELDDLTRHLDELEGRLRQVEEERDGLPASKPLASVPRMDSGSNRNAACPACRAALNVSGSLGAYRVVVASADPTPEHIEEIQARIAAAVAENDEIARVNAAINHQRKQLSDERSSLLRQVSDTQASIAAARKKREAILQAREDLATAEPAREGVSQDRIGELRKVVDLAKDRVRMFATKARADAIHCEIVALAALRDLVSPEGLRRSALDSGVHSINQTLSEVCDQAGWPEVRVNADLDLFMGGIPHVLLSMSEQYRCQAAMAVVLHSLSPTRTLLLIDAADVLDSAGRLGLITMLESYGVRAVVAMTAARDYAERVAVKFASAWWVDAGSVERIGG